MNLIEENMEEIRKRVKPTQQEAMKVYFDKMTRLRKKFMASMIDLVEKSVIDKRKMVVIPISKREDIPKLRHLIKRIAKSFGFKVKSVKKRWVVVEDTKFIVDKVKLSNYKVGDPVKTENKIAPSVKIMEPK